MNVDPRLFTATSSAVDGLATSDLARDSLSLADTVRAVPQLSVGALFELPGNIHQSDGGGLGKLGGNPADIFGHGPAGSDNGAGGLGGLFGHGSGGLGDGFGGDFGSLFGHGPGGPGDSFGGGPLGHGSGAPGGFGDIFGLGPGGFGAGGGLEGDLGGFGLPSGLGGGSGPSIPMPGDEVSMHEEGGRVYADRGEILQVSHNEGSTWKDVGSDGHEKHSGDIFGNQKGEIWRVNDDGGLEKQKLSTDEKPPAPTDDKSPPPPSDDKPAPEPEPEPQPDPDHKNGMPADDGSGGGINWHSNAMPADEGSGGGINWRDFGHAAMPPDDGTPGGPNWSQLFSAIDHVSATSAPAPSSMAHDALLETSLDHTEVSTSVAFHDVVHLDTAALDLSHMMAHEDVYLR